MSPRALACPASLKGVLRAAVAADALAARLRGAGVAADALPVADGGEGTVDVLCSRRSSTVETVDAFGRPRVARAGRAGGRHAGGRGGGGDPARPVAARRDGGVEPRARAVDELDTGTVPWS